MTKVTKIKPKGKNNYDVYLQDNVLLISLFLSTLHFSFLSTMKGKRSRGGINLSDPTGILSIPNQTLHIEDKKFDSLVVIANLKDFKCLSGYDVSILKFLDEKADPLLGC